MKQNMIIAGITLTLTMFASSAYAFSESPFGAIPEKRCYALGMVGYDSVINARLGVQPEHALGLSRIQPKNNVDEQVFYKDLLNTILGAYLWHKSPHDYALKVHFNCAIKSVVR